MTDNQTRIPIANIFYMLAYSWKVYPSWQKKFIDKSDYNSLLELLSTLLVESTESILKRGMARDYVLQDETIVGVKGKLEPGKTHCTLAWQHGKTCCTYDEFKTDIPINQAIKLTIFRILTASSKNIRKDTLGNLKKVYQRFGDISLVESGAARVLHSVKLQRHQQHYVFPIALCRFILKNMVFDENTGKYEFIDFERDHQKMGALFESFVFNYYKKHMKQWRVRSEEIHWDVEEGGTGISHLPVMRTDVTLERPDRKLVIDTKFYQEPMRRRFPGSPAKFAENNLYQLSTYLTQLAGCDKHPCNSHAEGMLLYPVLKPIPRLDVNMKGHRIRVESIDLNTDWRSIGARLEELVS